LPEDYMLTSISARRSTYKDQPMHDDDRLPIFLLNSAQEDRQLFTSQEFRITSPGGQKLDWLAGLYYDNQNLTSSRPIDISSALTYFVTGEFEPLSVTPDSTVETESYALYANLDYHITDDLTVTLGGRYTREDKSADYSIEGGCLTAGVCIYPQLELELEYEDTSFDPSMSVSYNVNEDITTYFRAATAYKSGGFNVDFIQPEELKIPGTDVYLPVVYTDAPGQTPFDKEEVVSYEWGLKMELLDRRLLLNAAIFQAEYEGFQVSRFNGTSYYIDNAGEATLKGVELDFIGQLSQEWRVIGSLGYLKSEFDVYETADNSGNALDLKGNQFPYAPDWTSSLAVEYTKDLGAYGVVFVRGDYTFKDEIYTSPENTVIEHVGSQEYFNGRISWFNEDESLSVSLWGKNLKDEKHVNYQTLDTTLSGLVYGELAKPRTYGVEVNYIF
jgi:iron complex outermembrane recepter protein